MPRRIRHHCPPPDTFGKSSRRAVGAYAVRRDLWRRSPQRPDLQAGTLSGNTVAMAAGLAMLEWCTHRVSKNNGAAKMRYAMDEAPRTKPVSPTTTRVGGSSDCSHLGTVEGGGGGDPLPAIAATRAFNRFFHPCWTRRVLGPG